MSQLNELKSLLVGDQAKEIAELKERVELEENRTRDVSEVLPEAIQGCINNRSDDLNDALSPMLSTSVKTTIEKDPDGFATIFFPALAPAIRMMIANSLRNFAHSMNQVIASTTTLKGLSWRLESWQTGVPYSEVALRKGLEYRVEQVFLIDKESGLLIESLINDDVGGLDSDAVSAMLTAIQSFVRDSFNATDDESLTNLVVGDHVVWMESGSKAVLACVIRGEAPSELRDQLLTTLDKVHKRYRKQLEGFDGSENLDGIEALLEPCLQLKLKAFAGKKQKMSWVTLTLIAALAFGLLSWFASNYEKKRIKNFVDQKLSLTPGVLPTSVFWDKKELVVLGLIDPLAEIPWNSIEESGLKKDQLNLQMKRYSSLEAAIFAKRLRLELAIPEEIKVGITETSDKKLATLNGNASVESIVSLRDRLDKLSRADISFDASDISISETAILKYVKDNIGLPIDAELSLQNKQIALDGVPEDEWVLSLSALLGSNLPSYTFYAADVIDDLIFRIKSKEVAFVDKDNLEEESEEIIRTIANDAKILNILIHNVNQQLQLGVKGYTDGDNAKKYNKELRVMRVEKVINRLIQEDVDASILQFVENNNIYGDSRRIVRLFPTIKPK